ncbi:TonB-dependent siderophore receptor [Pseudaeromonas sharmana]|uniref:TonB-dependent siderophore receptor n=1 Tax=Pseudaeromonas sharmana TaxID=328412 RepID=A0ABV8CN95_9GAMM
MSRAASPLALHPLARSVRLFLLCPSMLLSAAAVAETTLPTVDVTAQQEQENTEGSDSYTAPASRTATKLALTPRETPQSVTVVTRQKMDDFNQNSINDVLNGTVGVQVERIETDRSYYTARGFDITNFQVDGLGLPMANGNVNGDLDTALYDRVEVLKGASGLMTGTGNPSATVNMVRKRPTRDFQASLKAGAGSWDTYRAEGDASGALTDSGRVRGRMVLVQQDKHSYLDRYASDRSVAYGVVEGDLTDSTLLTIGYSLQKNDSDSPMWGALPLYYTDGSQTDYDVSTSTSSDWSFWNVDNHNLFVELSQQLANGWQAKGVYTFIETKQDSRLFYVYGTPDKQTGAGLLSYPGLYQMQRKQHIVDLNASGPFQLAGRTHQLVVGSTLSRSKVNELSLYSNDIGTALPSLEEWTGNYPQPAFDLYPNGSEWRDTENALYLATRFTLRDDLAWIAGTRYASWHSEGSSYGTTKDSAATGEWVPYTGIVYDLTDNLSTYASYTTIFAPQAKFDINRDRLGPIDGASYEAGLKGEFYDGQLNTSLALFESKQNNVAEAAGTIPGSTETYYVERDGIRSRGYELEVSGQVLEDWQLAGGYTRLRIEDADGKTTNTYTPKQVFKLSTSYQLQQWRLGASLNWQDDIYRLNGAGTYTRQSSYALLDLMARYEFNRQWYAALNAYNVTDEKYLTSLYWDQGYYGAPRSFNLSTGWKF